MDTLYIRTRYAVMGDDGVPVCVVADYKTAAEMPKDCAETRMMAWHAVDPDTTPDELNSECTKRKPCAPGAPCGKHAASAIRFWTEWDRRRIRAARRDAISKTVTFGKNETIKVRPPLPGEKRKTWGFTTTRDGKWAGCGLLGETEADARAAFAERTGGKRWPWDEDSDRPELFKNT